MTFRSGSEAMPCRAMAYSWLSKMPPVAQHLNDLGVTMAELAQNRFVVKSKPHKTTASAQIDFTIFDTIAGIPAVRNDGVTLWTSSSALYRAGFRPSRVAEWGHNRMMKEDPDGNSYGVSVFSAIFKQIAEQEPAFLHSDFDVHPLIDGTMAGRA